VSHLAVVGFVVNVLSFATSACTDRRGASVARAPAPAEMAVSRSEDAPLHEPGLPLATSSAPAAVPVGAALPVAERPPPEATLAVEGFDAAAVSFPRSAPFPQPVLVSTHGAGDTPEQMCELWRAILGDRGVVLCPAGPRMRAGEEGRYYPDHHALERVVFASLEALRARYASYVDPARVIYTGYSQGATMGALMIPAHGAECPRLVLVEGGFGDWSVERASTFAHAGGQRVLFVCGRQQCKNEAERSAAWLRGAGVEARVVAHVGEGHVIRVALVAGPSLEWLLGGDPRWARREGE
jgi:predicted esterase